MNKLEEFSYEFVSFFVVIAKMFCLLWSFLSPSASSEVCYIQQDSAFRSLRLKKIQVVKREKKNLGHPDLLLL